MIETLWKGVAIIYTSDLEKPTADNIGASISSRNIPVIVGHIRSFDISNAMNCYDAVVIVSPLGVAVRVLCGKFTNKGVDPPVIVVDPNRRFVIPLLGAHWGANDIAIELSKLLHLEPVITTASEGRNVTNIEQLAKILHCHIENIDEVASVDVALMKGEEVCVQGVSGLPPGVRGRYVVRSSGCRYIFLVREYARLQLDPDLGSVKVILCRPYRVSMGIGTHSDTDADEIAEAIREALDEVGIGLSSVRCISSVKPVVGEAAKILSIPFKLVTHSELDTVDDPCLTPPSRNLVKYGFRGVAEACAILGCEGRAQLVLRKRVYRKSVTVAIASCRE